MSKRIGIDLGGTKIEVIALDNNGNTLIRERRPTPGPDYQEIIRVMVDLVNLVESRIGERATVGVAMPGAISPATGKIKNSNTTCMTGQAFEQDLESALGRPVRSCNDANCFTLSEAVDGAAQGVEVVFGVILGTGVGGGITVNGKVLSGINAIAGEWGHNPLPWPGADELPGPTCYCGKQGCIETYLSGPGLARDYKLTSGEIVDSRLVAERANNGDTGAATTLARYIDRMARALANVINIVDPDIIVLGGGLSNISDLYVRVPELWSKYVFSDRVDTQLKPAKHGDSSGVRGAAWLWPAEMIKL
jgi:fructokinase